MRMARAILSAAFVLISGAAKAAVVLQFNAVFTGGVPSNFADSSGVVRDDMFYGVIVDTGNDGFRNQYDAVNLALDSTTSLQFAGQPTNDLLVVAQDLTSDYSWAEEGNSSVPGGNGSITGMLVQLQGGIAPGQNFQLVWFNPQISPSGERLAGVMSNPAFVIPVDNFVSFLDGPFVGIDPIRPANNITFVPEASSALLGLFGAAAMLRRRR